MTLSTIFDNHLIASWRQALKMHIMQLHLAITALAAALYNLAKAYPTMAQDVIGRLPPTLLHPAVINTVLIVWLIIGAYARLVPQPTLNTAPPAIPPGA